MNAPRNPVWYLNPQFVFAFVMAVSVCFFLSIPYEVFHGWKVVNIVGLGSIAEIGLLALGSFLVGTFLAPRNFAPNPLYFSVEAARTALAHSRILNILAGIAVALTIVMLLASGGLQAIRDSMSGRIRTVGIEGITTFCHASTASFALATAIWAGHFGDRKLRTRAFQEMVIAFGLSGGRAVLQGERIAILVPAIAAFACWLLVRREPLRLKLVAKVAGIIAMVGLIYGASEAARSFSAKQEREGLNQSITEYSVDRLGRYYALTLNSGVGRYMLFKSGERSDPFFSQTLGPMAKILSFGDLLFAYYPSNDSAAVLLEEAGIYNPEFTNFWGFATPFCEHPIVGFLFWASWGWYAQRLYRKAMCQSIGLIQIATFGLCLVGIIEGARVNLLGSIHLQLPILLLAIRSDLPKTIVAASVRFVTRTNPARSATAP